LPGVPTPVRFVSTTTNVVATDSAVVADTSAGDVVLNLPPTSNDLVQAGFSVYVKCLGVNRVQLVPTGTALIDNDPAPFYLYENDSVLMRAGRDSWTALVLARRVEDLEGLISDVSDLQFEVATLDERSRTNQVLTWLSM